jgi:opacity protein-like surface antigen
MKLIISAAAAILLCVSFPAAAYDIKGKSVVTGFVGGGFSHPGGYIPEGTTYDPGFSRCGGVNYGYGILDRLMLQGGIEFTRKPIILTSEDPVTTQTITLSFVNLTAGARYFFKSFYGEGGCFYGIRVTKQKIKTETNGVSDQYSIPDRNTSNDAGIYLGTGYLFKIKKNVRLDLGFRLEFGIPSTYNAGNLDLSTRNMSLRLGIAYTL